MEFKYGMLNLVVNVISKIEIIVYYNVGDMNMRCQKMYESNK